MNGWMNGWMDARQGNPVRTPARATLAGAMDDACIQSSKVSSKQQGEEVSSKAKRCDCKRSTSMQRGTQDVMRSR